MYICNNFILNIVVPVIAILSCGLILNDSTAAVQQVVVAYKLTVSIYVAKSTYIADRIAIFVLTSDISHSSQSCRINLMNIYVSCASITISVNNNVLIIAASFQLLTKLVNVLTIIDTVQATTLALSTTGLAELELIAVTIQGNAYRTGLHSAISILIAAEVVQSISRLSAKVITAGSCEVTLCLHSVIQIIGVHITSPQFLNLTSAGVYTQCAKTSQHGTSFVASRCEAIVFTFDLLDLTNLEVTIAISVVPSLVFIISIT